MNPNSESSQPARTDVKTWVTLERTTIDPAEIDATPSAVLDELLLEASVVDLYRALRLARLHVPAEARRTYEAFLSKAADFVNAADSKGRHCELLVSKLDSDDGRYAAGIFANLGREIFTAPVLVFASKLAAARHQIKSGNWRKEAELLQRWEAELAGMIRFAVRAVHALPAPSES